MLLGFFSCFLNTETVTAVILMLWHFIVVVDSTPTQKRDNCNLKYTKQ